MKKTTSSKLRLHKNVVATLGKPNMDKIAGGNDPLSILTCVCIDDPTNFCYTGKIKCGIAETALDCIH